LVADDSDSDVEILSPMGEFSALRSGSPIVLSDSDDVEVVSTFINNQHSSTVSNYVYIKFGCVSFIEYQKLISLTASGFQSWKLLGRVAKNSQAKISLAENQHRVKINAIHTKRT